MPLETPPRAWATTLLLATAACMGAGSVYATEPGYQITVGVAETDNVQLLPSGGSTDTTPFQELEFTWHDKRPLFDADIDADLEHVSYIPHYYDDEVIGNFLGQGRVNLLPQLLTWSMSDNFGQGRLNPLAPITPANRENINYFTTGPKLSLPLGPELKLEVTGQYGRVDYQDSPLDSNRLTGRVAFVHDFSLLSSISLDVVDERVDFEQDLLDADYSSQEVFVRYDTGGSRTKLGVDLGYSRIQETGVNTGSYLARISLSRELSAASIIGLSAGHNYSDGASSFLQVQTIGGATLNTQSVVQSEAPFSSDYATLAWNFQYSRTSWGINASYYQDRYTTDAELNNDLGTIQARISRQISPVIELALTENVTRQSFASEGVNATETNTGLQLTWHAGRNLSVMFAYFLVKSTADISTDSYTENGLWLSVGYGRPAELPPGPPPVRLPGNFF
jgi:hypothetical protein